MGWAGSAATTWFCTLATSQRALAALALLALLHFVGACGEGQTSTRSAFTTPCPPPTSSCKQAGILNTNTGDCRYAFVANGTPCPKPSSDVCTLAAACSGGACMPAQRQSCTALDACGLPIACDAVAGCGGPQAASCSYPVTTAALSGCPDSDYSTPVHIGNQNFSMLIDTGSTSLAVAAATCSSCGVSPSYAPSNSAVDLNNTTRASYGDNSGWNGEAFRDQVTIAANPSPVTVAIASITQQTTSTPFFKPNSCIIDAPVASSYSGIFGLGGAGLATPFTTAFLDQLKTSGQQLPVVSVQLCNNGGRMWLGGYDSSLVTSPPQYSPLDPSTHYYAVTLTDLALGANSLGFRAADFGPAVVDTGTTALLLPTAVNARLTSQLSADANFKANFGSTYFTDGNCHPAGQNLTSAQLDALLPRLSLTLPVAGSSQTFTLSLPATGSYLLPTSMARGGTVYCSGLQAADIGFSILGSAVLRSHLVIFHPGAQQVGFAPHAQQPCLTGM